MTLEERDFQAAELEFLTTNRPASFRTRGAVASPHYLTTQFGKEILNAGGHAVEAAIATNAVLNVVYPHMSGLGGDLMAIIWDSKEQKPVEINGTGYLGENISIKDFSDLNAIPIRGPKSAITVPGTVEV